MTKRKLNRRQTWRVQKIQKERLKRAQSQTTKLNELVDNQHLGPAQTGRVVAHYGANLEVEDQFHNTYHCLVRANLPSLVCGDQVVWQQVDGDIGVITSLIPRSSLLARPDYHGNLKPVAANIDQMMIVVAPEPAMDEDLINRYLVASELTEITPLLVVNKVDLLTASDKQKLAPLLDNYQHIGYQVIHTSTQLRDGLHDLRLRLTGKTSVFVGQSGVGKSSLIKSLIPDADIRIGELSSATGLGKHTTSVTILYHLAHSGSIIDSPGVREFGLGNVNQETLARGFVEFRPLLGQCKFKDCQHQQEPDCAIKQSVAYGGITQSRYASYLRLIKTLSHH